MSAYRVGEIVLYAAQDEPYRAGRIVDAFTGAVTGSTVYVIDTPHLGETGFYAAELRRPDGIGTLIRDALDSRATA